MKWDNSTFADEDIVEIIDGDRGKNYPKQEDFLEDGFCLFLNAGNVTVNGFDFGNRMFISEEKDNALRKGKLIRNDIVLTTRGTLGNSAYYKDTIQYDHMRINSGMVIFRSKEDRLRSSFLYQYLRSSTFCGFVSAYKSGVAQPQLPIRDMKAISIPLPPLLIQTRIAEILSAYDDLIENNRRQIKLLEESARLLYREWFVRLRFPGHEQVKVVDGVPEGWERLSVGLCIDFNPKVRLEKDNPSKYVPMSSLSTENMTINELDIETRPSPTGVRFQNQDTLLARITPCLENGKTAYVNFIPDSSGACGSTEFIVMRGKKYTPRMTYCLAREENFREKAIQCMTGVDGRQRVKVEALSEYQVLCPNFDLQKIFDDAVQPIFEQIKNLSIYNSKLAAARDLLLPRLMSGDIEV